MAAGDIIIVDTETTGLIQGRHVPFEVSWVKWDPESRMIPKTFYIPVGDREIREADNKALEVNGWSRDRLAAIEDDTESYYEFLDAVRDSTLMGANVRFDAAMLVYRFAGMFAEEPWHYRLFDIEAYIAGTFGLDHVPGNAEARKLIDSVEYGEWSPTEPDHTSANDVRAVREFYAWCLWRTHGSMLHRHPSNMDLG